MLAVLIFNHVIDFGHKPLLTNWLPGSEHINPIHTGGGGGGVFSTSKPVNCSELQNETSYNLETW